ncbi:hypothetical protein MMC08_004180 [Hypocenomyce scalaris]|nr:hypothetical protein [Hypocenomyce scalaris]
MAGGMASAPGKTPGACLEGPMDDADVNAAIPTTSIREVFPISGSAMVESLHFEASLPTVPSDAAGSVTFEQDNSEASLPMLPPTARPQLLALGRKRTWEDSMADSSDPPVFSSDDIHDSAENYTQPRTKRQHQGTWWGEEPAQSTEKSGSRRRGSFKRTDDSGVWLASDDLEEDQDEVLNVEESQLAPKPYPDLASKQAPTRYLPLLGSDPEESTQFEGTEVLPTSGLAIVALEKKLEEYQKKHKTHWYRFEDIRFEDEYRSPGIRTIVRISNADDWDGLGWKSNAAGKIERAVEDGQEVVDLE